MAAKSSGPLWASVVRGAVADREHLEAAVVGLLGRAALEHDHRGDRVGAHQRADVKALDPQRNRVQPERVLEPVERLDPLLAAALGAQLLLVDGQSRVALGELEDPALVTPLGRPDLDRAAPRRALSASASAGAVAISLCTTSSGGTDIALA